jgi:hypothetical protein
LKTRTIILLIGFFLFALSVTMYSSSADKPTSFLSIITIVFASISASISAEAAEQAKINTEQALISSEKSAKITHAQTERALKQSEEIAQRTHEETLRSLKQTRLTIEKAENEHQMREIEDSLRNFYSPLRVYLDKDSNRHNEEFGDIFRHMHLATDKTKEQFNKFMKRVTSLEKALNWILNCPYV